VEFSQLILYANCIYNLLGKKTMATETGQSGARDVVINIRANRYQRELIDRAADSRGKNRSDFMLEAAGRRKAFCLTGVTLRWTLMHLLNLQSGWMHHL
jgi:hypothetical protein